MTPTRESGAIRDAGGFPRLAPQDRDSPAFRRVRELALQVAVLARRILGPEIEIIWFGSWPRGRAHERSDVDLAIRSPKRVTSSGLRRLREAIEELPTLYSIDVVDLEATGSLLREEIDRYGQSL